MYSYATFLSDCKWFIERSEELRDGWKLVEFHDTKFLSKKESKSFDNDEGICIEYHVIHDPSYQVPVLYFSATYSCGRLLKPTECHALLHIPLDTDNTAVISQRDHPVLDCPYYYVHPCQTSGVMDRFSSAPNFIYLLTFLSTIGPIVGLHIPHKYTLKIP